MKNFPQESIEQAKEIVKKYKRRFTSKREIAANLYDNKFLEIYYGFDESIKSGNCGRYLHEIKKEADCFTMAGVIYLIAREAGLKPKMHYAYGIKDVNEGENPDNKGIGDHAFVTVSIKKNQRHMLDPQMGLFGKINAQPKRNRMEVYNKKHRNLITRNYASIHNMSEKEYLEKIEKNRSSQGGRIALSSTQRVNAAGNNPLFLTYLPETNELKASLHLERLLFGPEPYSRCSIKDLVTPVGQDGSFNFENGTFHFYSAINSGWGEHEGSQVPLSFPVRDAIKFWNILNALTPGMGRKSKIQGISSPNKLMDKLLKIGFDDDFKTQKNSIAEQIIENSNLEDILNQVQQAQRKAVSKFIPKCKEDEISYKTLLRRAQYVAQTDQNKSDENPYGLVFSKEQHEELFKEGFRYYKKCSVNIIRTTIDCTRMSTGIKKGTRYLADRKYQSTFTKELENVRYFDNMAAVKKSDIKFLFNVFADMELFHKNIDLEKTSIKELEKSVKLKHLKRAAQQKLFNNLVTSGVRSPAFFLASYKKGLQKILAVK